MEITEIYSVVPVFLASLMGSPHCGAMCGGFVAIYSHGVSSGHWRAHLLYSLGRLFTYLLLGAGAALIGKSVDDLSGVAHLSSALVGALLILFGFMQVIGAGSKLNAKIVQSVADRFRKIAKPFFLLDTKFKAFLIGAITTLLPCGWLYTFVGLSMASASLTKSFFIMTFFWAGSLPLMLSLGVVSKFITGRLGAVVPRLTGVLLMLSGLISLSMHIEHSDHSHNHQHHHHH